MEKTNLTEVKFLLRRFEQRLNNCVNYSVDLHDAMVHIASKVFNNNVGLERYNEEFGSTSIEQRTVRNNMLGGYQSNRGRGKNFAKPSMICQLCGKACGHQMLL